MVTTIDHKRLGEIQLEMNCYKRLQSMDLITKDEYYARINPLGEEVKVILGV